MDKYVGNIIASCREDTGETDYSDTNGIPQSVPLEEINTAQMHCQGIIYSIFPHFFEQQETIDGVAGQEEYDLPSNAWLGGSISMVEYSPDGQEKNYYELDGKSRRFRAMSDGSLPNVFYQQGANSFIVSPRLSNSVGKFRVTYAAAKDTLDIRRAKVASRTLNGGADSYATITFEDDATLDESVLALNEFLCINTPGGVVEYYNIQYDYDTDYDETTKVLTLNPNVLMSLGSITAGSFVTVGKYSTTHSKLDNICLPIFRAFVSRRFYMGKSSSDVDEETQNIKAHTDMLSEQYMHMKGNMAFKPRYKGKFERV